LIAATPIMYPSALMSRILKHLGAALLIGASTLAVGQPSRDALPALAARFGFPEVTLHGETLCLHGPATTLSFTIFSRRLLFNNVLIWMNDAVTKSDGMWTVADIDTDAIIEPLVLQPRTLAGLSPVRTVVLDPGHGGEDSGAVGYKDLHENKAVLDIAKRVKRKLKAAGVTVRLTREKDTDLTLPSRTQRAQQVGADLFVSIHLNSIPNRTACGLETYLLTCPGFPSTTPGHTGDGAYTGNRFDEANIILAYQVHRGVLTCTGMADRGIKHARFDVLQNAPCPAILIECGFVSSPTEAVRLMTDAHRDAIADGVARGIVNFATLTRKPNPAGP
jgi:N-acetylmuramoyl-L-alanine amidase